MTKSLERYWASSAWTRSETWARVASGSVILFTYMRVGYGNIIATVAGGQAAAAEALERDAHDMGR